MVWLVSCVVVFVLFCIQHIFAFHTKMISLHTFSSKLRTGRPALAASFPDATATAKRHRFGPCSAEYEYFSLRKIQETLPSVLSGRVVILLPPHREIAKEGPPPFLTQSGLLCEA
jgi:hypothetical protein